MKEVSQKEALQQLMDCLVAQSETDMTQQIMEQALAWYQAKHVCLYEVDDDRKKAVLVNGSPDIRLPYIDGEVLENWLNQCETDSFLTFAANVNDGSNAGYADTYFLLTDELEFIEICMFVL